MNGWRAWALAVGGAATVCGLLIYRFTGAPVILILGLLVIVTAASEPIYGRANRAPGGAQWRPTDERFVDPESGKLVTVWFNHETGQRRYVEEPGTAPPAA